METAVIGSNRTAFKNTEERLNVLLIVTIANRSKQPKPFRFENENNSYAYLSSMCAEIGLDLYVTHFENILSDTHIFSWTHKENTWVLEECAISEMSISYADLPQDFPKANMLRSALVKNNVIIVNDLELSDCATDKLATYNLLPEFVPPTFDVSEPNLKMRIQETFIHPDLMIQQLILKPRYGERGKGIEIIDFSELDTDKVLNKKNYIVQPILESKGGIPALNIHNRHDLRMLIHDGKILQFFVKVARKDSFISNMAHGAELIYYELEELPQNIRALGLEIDKRLVQYAPRIYSLDVGIGESGKIWVYELNTMPGIVWQDNDDFDKRKNIEVYEILIEIMEVCKKRCLQKIKV